MKLVINTNNFTKTNVLFCMTAIMDKLSYSQFSDLISVIKTLDYATLKLFFKLLEDKNSSKYDEKLSYLKSIYHSKYLVKVKKETDEKVVNLSKSVDFTDLRSAV